MSLSFQCTNETISDPKTGRSVEVSCWYSGIVNDVVAQVRNELGSVASFTRAELIRRLEIVEEVTAVGLACACFRHYDDLFFYDASKSLLMQ